MWRVGWLPNTFTVCLSAPPPFINKFNMFVLNLITFEWKKVNIENATSLPNGYFSLMDQTEMYADEGNTLIFCGNHHVIKDK
jgi:hypothetical protein